MSKLTPDPFAQFIRTALTGAVVQVFGGVLTMGRAVATNVTAFTAQAKSLFATPGTQSVTLAVGPTMTISRTIFTSVSLNTMQSASFVATESLATVTTTAAELPVADFGVAIFTSVS